MDKCRLPVFLVLVDVTSKQGYWCFLQRYAREELADEAWRRQKTVTIRVPIEQSLEDIASLEAAVREAETYMTDLRPGSMDAAARAEKHRIENIDPRLTAEVSFQHGQQNVDLSSHHDIDLQITASGLDAVQEMQNLVERGLPAHFKSGDLKIKGSPLFESIAGDLERIEWKRSVDSDFVFVAVDASGNPVTREIRLNGKLEGGQKERRYQGEIANAPLVTRYKLHIGDLRGDDRRVDNRLVIETEIGRWTGQRISRLAYFAPIDEFFRALTDGAFPQMEVWIDGSQLHAEALDRGNSSATCNESGG